jgi:hypothetical protein
MKQNFSQIQLFEILYVLVHASQNQKKKKKFWDPMPLEIKLKPWG